MTAGCAAACCCCLCCLSAARSFDGAVKLKAIAVIGGAGGSCPMRMKAFTNRDNLDFATVATLPAVQVGGEACGGEQSTSVTDQFSVRAVG